MALPAPELGPIMSVDDPVYAASAAFAAGTSGTPPPATCPGFDLAGDLRGRWVRSPTKFVGWDTYMEFFGLSGDKALQETEEPQEHVVLGFDETKLTLRHRLPWRDGLDCEYTVPIDGSWQPVPPAMVARASSSWKVNDLMSWSHAWDDGAGNPLHVGLRTEQKLVIAGTEYALRYWRTLIRPDEMRVNVEVTYVESGKYAVHTQRFFRRIDVHPQYAVAVPPLRGPGLDAVLAALPQVATWVHNGRNVRMAVLPEASNMPAKWRELPAEEQWRLAENFPTAGRACGPFLSAVRQCCAEHSLWACVGIVLRKPAGEAVADVLRGVALVGADGWLHGVHADPEPPQGFAQGLGDWPATQRARPKGVYDTELGRVAVCCRASPAALAEYGKMGCQLVVAPPLPGADGRVDVALAAQVGHSQYTRYDVCGPEPSEQAPDKSWAVVTVQGSTALTAQEHTGDS